jgi:membrane protease subunit (stomatin/prohibitin family)
MTKQLLEKSIKMAKAMKRRKEWKFCRHCGCGITETDVSAGQCTNCGGRTVN